MTEDQLQLVVDSWLRATDDRPPDPVGSVNLAMAKVRRTRQFRRWWPLPLLARLSSPALASPSRELKPEAIPATNGHAPVPAGRTRALVSTPRLVAATAVLALAAGLLWSSVLTPPPQEQLPGAAAERTDFIIATGTSTVGGGPEPTGDDDMSDPRVSGRVELTNSSLNGSEDSTGVRWGQYTLVNEGGTWEGEWIGLWEVPSGAADGMVSPENAMVWAYGTGDYEGWSYVTNYTGDLTTLSVRGLIYQGDIPPTVALGLLDAEQE